MNEERTCGRELCIRCRADEEWWGGVARRCVGKGLGGVGSVGVIVRACVFRPMRVPVCTKYAIPSMQHLVCNT